MPSIDAFVQQKLNEIKEKHLFRSLHVTRQIKDTNVLRGAKSLISFSSNDYFGLSQHPKVKAAAIEAINTYGAGAGAARMVTGNHPLYAELEEKLAKTKEKEASLIFGSGYLANLGTIAALVGKGDIIIADKLIHACMIDGAVLSGAKLYRFPHNNMQKCQELLETHRKNHQNCLILTETIFSMDGDRAPLGQLLELCKAYDSWLLADDAHGLGIVPTITSPNLVYVGTLSKGLGSYGGYVATSKVVTDYLVNTARPFIFATGLPPATIAAASTALDVLKDNPTLAKQALANARCFSEFLNLPEAQSPIVPVIIGEPDQTIHVSERLYGQGFLVSAIRPPTVPKGTSRLRFTFSSLHTKADIENLAACVRILYK